MLLLLAATMLAAPAPMDLATASPDAAALEVGWRDGIRAKGGGRIRILGEGDDVAGGFFEFLGFIELHNAAGYHGVIPYQFWRGRFAFEAGHRWHFGATRPWTLRLTGAIEHESDHPTGGLGESGFVNLNDVAATLGVRHGLIAPTHAALTTRLHVVTCTRDPNYCGAGGGLYGGPGFELEASVTQEFRFTGVLQKWSLFAAVWGQLTLPTTLIFPGRRLSVRLGVMRHRRADTVSFFLQGLGGTDVGYFRQRDVLQLGTGIGWAMN